MSKLIGRRFNPGNQTFTRQQTKFHLPFQAKSPDIQSNFDSLIRQLDQVLFQLQEQVDLINQQLNPEYVRIEEVTNHVGGEDIPAGGLAVKNAVDLSTSEVTNKTADNITYTAGGSVDSLKPAESGADATAGKSLSVLANRVMSNITDAGALATKSAVDLSTAEVTNKTADNISESVTRKWAGESGADVTSGKSLSVLTNRTMSNITDAGSLATKNTVASGDIDSGAVTAVKIGTSAVTASKIDTGAVTAAKIGTSAVTASKISTSAVTASKISTSAVTTDKIATSAVTNVKVSNDISPAKIELSGTTKLDTWQQSGQPAKIAGGEVASNTIDTTQINASAVSRLKIASNAVSGDKFTESVVDEYQTMGSTLSDAQWDALTA